MKKAQMWSSKSTVVFVCVWGAEGAGWITVKQLIPS